MKTRAEAEMLGLILGTAKEDANIRAVILEGSRANPNAKKDPFQDFDVIYAVTTLDPYRSNMQWIRRFGELMVLQMPDGMGGTPAPDHKFTYLMQFLDGNRIDLNIYLAEKLRKEDFSSLRTLLLDKDGRFDYLSTPGNEGDYFPKPPAPQEYFECCNEFWWVVPYVAKGLWREDLSYARAMFETILRDETMKMLTWNFGIETSFLKNPGKFGKNFAGHFDPEIGRRLLATMKTSTIEEVWSALLELVLLFRKSALIVSAHFGFEYPHDDDEKVSKYITHVKTLSPKAVTIYG
jgi:aminoglycoside 6-adenylyltransferase